ncbi:alpha/beta fold hydrolase [Streptomyces libani]|uniref:alpha/beta fold hydrolase n=1 Tax=Streptomyces nigrescens TaxID=1920 RepID=UPI00362A9D7D
MDDVHVTQWDGTAGRGPRAVFAHGILTWGDDERYGFAAQRPLADRYRLLLMDRRGYGRSPDIAHSDYEADADDLIRLLGDGGHLVGHAYGGVSALVAAARRPDLVRSLTLIQPGALRPAAGHPVVAAALERARKATTQLPEDYPPEEFLRASTEALGMPAPEPTPRRLRAAASSMAERPCWDAEIPLEPLAAAPWPKLLISGDWAGAPPLYKEYAGEPLIACAEFLAEAIGAGHLVVPGYYPHTQRPAEVNAALRELWGRGDGLRDGTAQGPAGGRADAGPPDTP